MNRLKKFGTHGLLVGLSISLFTTCQFKAKKKKGRVSTIFIGIDTSGSFTRSKSFRDGLAFLGEYIHGHLEGKGGLGIPRDLYVGGIGGDSKEEPQAFFPRHDFMGLSARKVEKKLAREFGKQKDNLTDFNIFFDRVKSIVKQKNLTLSPIDLVLITDGVPEIQGKSKTAIKQGYAKINVRPLENLSRHVSIRILYASPKVGNNWRNYVPTSKIKVWTVEPVVMFGWREQLKRNKKAGLYRWIHDNIDLKIQSRGL